MPRPPRLQVPGGIFHLTSRGNRRQSIYHDDHDRRMFLILRDRIVQRYGWGLHAHCLMTNHFHLLVETPEPNLSEGMHRLNGGYAQYFNDRYELDGHLFDRRFGSRLVESDEDFAGTLSYIAFNPVKAGLCEHPWEWRWSSFYGRRDYAFG